MQLFIQKALAWLDIKWSYTYSQAFLFSAVDKIRLIYVSFTFKWPITTAADNNFDYFFYLPEKTSPDISCELSAKQEREVNSSPLE